MEDDEEHLVFHSLTPAVTPSNAMNAVHISTEIKVFKEKFKELKWHLSHCTPNKTNVQGPGTGDGHGTYLSPSVSGILPQSQPGMNRSTPSPMRSDHEILEEFHQLVTHTGFTEKWSVAQITLKLSEYLEHLGHLQKALIHSEINVFNRENQMAKNGSRKFTKCLDELQPLCEDFVDLYWVIQHQIGVLSLLEQQNPNAVTTIRNLKETWKNNLQNFLSSNLIVECQPPQVMKINTRFPNVVSLRFLIGSKIFSNASVALKADIISEAESREIFNDSNYSKRLSKCSGHLANGLSKFDFSSRKCTAYFKNLQLRRIDRKCKKVKGQQQNTSSNLPMKSASSPTDTSLAACVTDEKFCIHFHMDLKVMDADFHVWTVSLPVVVVTHGVQEAQAWATITWDNGFSSIQRLPFQVPPKVPWEPLADTLNQKFESVTGRGLESYQILALKAKLLNYEQSLTPSSSAEDQESVSFSKFSKVPLLGGTFTFWDWFYNALKLIEKHGLRSWRNRAIYGFIGRCEAERLLAGYPPGTFLVRFSDTVLGGISIAYVARNGQVRSVAPFTSKNLSFRSLTDSIWDLENLVYLYPNIPKEQGYPPASTTNFGLPSGSPGASSNSNVQNQRGSTSSSVEVMITECHYVSSFPKITLPASYS